MGSEDGLTPFEMRNHLMMGPRTDGSSGEVDEALLEPEEVPATRETPDEVVKATEGVVEVASAADPRCRGRESFGMDLEAEGWGRSGAAVAEDSDWIVGDPARRLVDEVLEEAVHPHPPVRVAVEEGVGVFQEEVETGELRPPRRQLSSKQASLWR